MRKAKAGDYIYDMIYHQIGRVEKVYGEGLYYFGRDGSYHYAYHGEYAIEEIEENTDDCQDKLF